MKKLLVSMIGMLPALSLAAASQKAEVFFATPANNTKIVQSTSGFCHDKDTPSKKTLNVYTSGAKKNVFPDLMACIGANGKVPVYLKRDLEATEIQEIEALQAKANEKKVEEEKKEEAITKFGGLSLSPALMFVFYDDDVLQDVTVEDGVISVNQKLDTEAVLGMESHFFFTPGEKKEFGHGPYVSVGLIGEDGIDPLSTYGLGYMIGWRKSGDHVNSWNVGLGFYWNNSAIALKEGLEDGGATTITDPSKLTKKEQAEGLTLIFSAAF